MLSHRAIRFRWAHGYTAGVRVLVTGGFGHLGSHTLPELRRLGHTVRVLSARTPVTRRVARSHPDVETVWGDVRRFDDVSRAVAGVEAVIHLVALLPPAADEHPDLARSINVDGTANVIAACQAQPEPPRLIFTSSFDVHGNTLAKAPPRHVDDPLVAANPYAAHKIEAEGLVRASGLQWCIFRLADMPILGLRRPPAIMFEIAPENRIESLHVADAGLAIATAVGVAEVWNRVFFLGGGVTCQLRYRDYVNRMLAAMGIAALPDSAFATGATYPTDWLDTAESEALLRYQRHSFDDITRAVAVNAGWKRRATMAIAPLARLALLWTSPYWRDRR